MVSPSRQPGRSRFLPTGSLVVLLTAPFLFAGCTSAGMSVPTDLEAVPALAVEGRGGFRPPSRIAFGGFEAADVDRSWTAGRGWSVGLGRVGGGRNRASQEYDFAFRADGEDLGMVACEATAGRGTIGVGSVGVDAASSAALDCRLHVGDAIQDWSVSVGATRDRHLEGQLTAGEIAFRLVGTGRGGGWTPADRFGFEVRRGETVVAAIETVGRGRVWLAPELEPRDRRAVAAAALALLLYEDLHTE